MESYKNRIISYLSFFIVFTFFLNNILYSDGYTPEGKPLGIYGYVMTEFTDEVIVYLNEESDRFVEDMELDARRVGDASRTYNCHGYAWRVSEGQSNMEITTPANIYYFSDGTYSNDSQHSYLSCSSTDATHISYVGDDHSVRKIKNSCPMQIEDNRNCVAKWGRYGLYIHAFGSDPYGPTDYDYYQLKTTHTGILSNYPKTWIGAGGQTHTITGDVTVPSGITLKILHDATIKFDSDKKLTINGTLDAQGTSDNHIVFTSSSATPSRGDWYGIRFEDSSDDANCILKYCEIEYASYGIYCYRAKPKIENNTISNNDDGIFLWYTSPSIKNNTITQNNRGIFGNHSNSEVRNNNISNNSWYGAQFWYSSSPVFYDNSLNSNSTNGAYFCSYSDPKFGPTSGTGKGYNVIKNNGYNGIYARDYSDPFMGSTGPYNTRIGGYNSIYDNNSKNALAYNNSHIEAEHNYWKSQFGRIYAVYGSSIDNIPYLGNDPGGGSSLGKSSFFAGGNYNDDKYADFNPMAPDTNRLSDLWLWANELWLTDQPHEAINVYKILTRKFSETIEAKRSLVKLVHLYSETGTGGLSGYLNSLIQSKKIDMELKHIAFDLLVGVYVNEGKFNQAIHTCNKIIQKYPDTESEKLALFHLVFIYNADLQESGNAEAIVEIMKQKYPDDELTLIASAEMGEKVDWSLAKRGYFPKPEVFEPEIPDKFALGNNYPNPFNPMTTIAFDLPEESHVTLIIYDISGREIVKLVDGNLHEGFRHAVWDGKDKSGTQVSSGVYLYSIRTSSDFSATKKMVLVR